MNRTTARLTGLAAALLTATLVLAGCSGADAPVAGDSTTSSATSSAGQNHNDADVAFATNMRLHHQGALAMSALATDRAADQRVKDLAARIQAAQQPEIDTMTGWLADWGADASSNASDSMSGMPGMDHGSGGTSASDMPGMDMSGMTDEDMAALTAASGAEFDRLFLEKMSAHHSAAVNMAKEEIANGKNPDAIAMATSIRDSQTAEITEMQQLLTSLGS